MVIVVGGSLLALRGMRDATRDVDSIRPLDDELRRATHVVAERHGLAANWLNDHAAPWAPATMNIFGHCGPTCTTTSRPLSIRNVAPRPLSAELVTHGPSAAC